MSRLVLALAALALSLSGCAVYGDDYGYYRPGYSVQYYESYPAYRFYYYDDDRDHRWHHDRYRERRHSHYAPGYDGRYQWYGDKHRYYRDRQWLHRPDYPTSNRGWGQRDRDRRDQHSWQRHDGQRYDGYPRKDYDRDRRHERSRNRDQDRDYNRRTMRDDGRRWSISN